MKEHTIRLAVVVSHTIQYYAPWFAQLASEPDLKLQVFHLWDFGIKARWDQGFAQVLQWDVPLNDGYASTLVPNASRNPGTHHFGGLHNPTLVNTLLAWKPDALVIFGYAYRSHLQLLLDPRLWSVPILFRGDSHQLVLRRGWKPFAARILRRVLFRRFAAALAVGQANAAWLRASGIPAKRIVIAPHAVDNARFQAIYPAANAEACRWRMELGIAASSQVILFAGKFEPKKRPFDLLSAFADLDHTTATLVFVGAGPLETALRSRAEAFDPGRVILKGFQNQSAMPRIYALADLVVLPSYGAGETWGLCINEAMNLARPVIVSSHVGCGPDLVIPGKTGWIFPAGDVGALRSALAEALSDPARLKAMGKAARAHIDHYSYAQATEGLLQALEAVTGRP